MCVFVALSVQPAMCVSHIVIRGLCGYTIFLPHYIKIGNKKKVIERNVCFVVSTKTPFIPRRNGRNVVINVYLLTLLLTYFLPYLLTYLLQCAEYFLSS